MSLKVTELKEILRARGLPVSGKKAELITRLGRTASAAPIGDSAAFIPSSYVSLLTHRAVMISACKSWGKFTRAAKALSERLIAADPSICVFGHERKGWTPPAALLDPVRPEKTVFEVKTADGKVFCRTGPEPRPFANLTALDIEELASQVFKHLCSDWENE